MRYRSNNGTDWLIYIRFKKLERPRMKMTRKWNKKDRKASKSKNRMWKTARNRATRL